MTPRPTCRCARAPSLQAGTPVHLAWCTAVHCTFGRLLGAALCRGYAAPEVHLQSDSTTLVTRLHFSKLARPNPAIDHHIRQGSTVRDDPRHGNQIRIHAVPQGGPLPVLPDLGAERGDQVSKPIRAPRGWSIGTTCLAAHDTARPACLRVGYTLGAHHVERAGSWLTRLDPPGRSSRNPTRP